ncbi:MAG: carboxypeptidase regulatory-like domain-containing protein [Coriobacteriia bacterium]|nr:carboxypeptidase regulatory-like domain-containing protein [Coriobacteriia bacterium]
MVAMKMPSRTRSDEGFTLIELVAASAILFIVVMGVVGSMTFAARATQSNGIRNSAMAVAQERIERARNIPYDSVGVRYATGGYGNPPGTILSPEAVSSGDNTFTVYTEVTWARDATTNRATYKKMTVSVQWSTPTTGSITLETGIFGNSSVLSNGDLEVYVKDADTNQPVADAQVVVDPVLTGALARTAWTDSVGKAFYGFIDSGLTTMSVSASGYIFDASQVSTYSVQASTLNQMILYVQRPSTIDVRVLDGSDSAVPSATVTVFSARHGTRVLTTGDDGHARFTGSFVGSYTVSVGAMPGYVTPDPQSVTITSGNQTVNANFVADQNAGVKVIVRDKVTDSLITGAVISVVDGTSGIDAPGSPFTTTATASFTFENMIAGLYDINVTRTGVSGTGPCYVASATVDFPVVYGALPTKTIYLTPWGTLWVRLSQSGTYLNTKSIAISGPWTANKTTSSTGYLKIPYLPAGTYTLKYGTKTATYVVSDGVIPASATTIAW